MFLKKALVPLIALGGLSLSHASAAEDYGWFIGASVGSASYAFDGDLNVGDIDFDLDDSATAWKVYGGYQFLPFLAIEAGYNDFGSFDESRDGNRAELSADGYNIWALGILPLGFIDFYGKVGVHFYESELSGNLEEIGDALGDDSGEDLAYGIGAGFEILDFTIRAEYEYFEADVLDDLQLVSVGLTYSF